MRDIPVSSTSICKQLSNSFECTNFEMDVCREDRCEEVPRIFMSSIWGQSNINWDARNHERKQVTILAQICDKIFFLLSDHYMYYMYVAETKFNRNIKKSKSLRWKRLRFKIDNFRFSTHFTTLLKSIIAYRKKIYRHLTIGCGNVFSILKS